MTQLLDVAIVLACVSPFMILIYRYVREHEVDATRITRREFDGVQLGSAGQLFEIVDPDWWRVDRWIKWFRATGRVEMTVPDAYGKPRLHELRTIPVRKTRDVCPLCKRPRRKS